MPTGRGKSGPLILPLGKGELEGDDEWQAYREVYFLFHLSSLFIPLWLPLSKGENRVAVHVSFSRRYFCF